MDEQKDNNNEKSNPETPDTVTPVPEDASPAAGEAAPATSVTSSLTGEKVLDIALGVAVIAGEALDSAAKRFSERAKELQEQSPTFWEAAEEQGRPVREKLISTLKGQTAVTTDGETTSGNAGLADSLRNLGSNIGITVGGGNARQSAEEEIRGLEDRVRELEQVVVSGKTGLEPESPAAPVTETPATNPEGTAAESPSLPEKTHRDTVSETTTAEAFSYAFGVDQHEDTLEASPYAVSETADEIIEEAIDAATAAEPVAESESALDLETSAAGDGETETVTDPEPSVPTLTASAGRSGRKKQRDFEPEAADDSTPTPSPEA